MAESDRREPDRQAESPAERLARLRAEGRGGLFGSRGPRRSPPEPVGRSEPALLGLFFFACWMAGLLALLRVIDLTGSLPLSLYGYYSTAAALGWLAGNLYMAHRRRAPEALQRGLRLVYLFGPPSFLALLRAMAPAEALRYAPYVPLYAVGVYLALFHVPVLLRDVGRVDR